MSIELALQMAVAFFRRGGMAKEVIGKKFSPGGRTGIIPKREITPPRRQYEGRVPGQYVSPPKKPIFKM